MIQAPSSFPRCRRRIIFEKALKKFEELFGIDLRSLALFRIALGTCLLIDLGIRASDLAMFYTDTGVLPRGALIDQFKAFWNFSVPLVDCLYNISIHLMAGTAWFEALLFILAAFFALMLVIGYRTRLATWISWFLLISLHIRNPLVIQGGDVLLRLLLFWSIFLPLGASYSVDSALRDPAQKLPVRVFSGGTIGILLQIVFVYWFTAIVKLGPDSKPIWWDQGTAVYYALSLDQFTKPFGHFLYHFPGLLKITNYGVLLFEILGPFLLFFPVWTGPIRTFTAALFILLHMSFWMCLTLGPFPWVGSLAMFLFLPSWFWERLSEQSAKSSLGSSLKIYYDNECAFCRKSVYLLRTFLILPAAQLLPAQDDSQAYSEMEKNRSWVVRDLEGRLRFGYDAFLGLSETSPIFRFLTPILKWGPAAFLGNICYRYIAGHRQAGSLLVSPLSFRPVRVKSSLTANVSAIFFLIYIAIWNFEAIQPRFHFPGRLEKIGVFLQISQYWNMFSPPLRGDGWFVIPGLLKDGTEVDVYKKGGPLDWQKPQNVYGFYKNERWRKYMSILFDAQNQDQLMYFGKYLCYDWNSRHAGGRQLAEFEIYYMQEMSLPNYETSVPQKRLLWKHYCFELPAQTKARWS